jgi:predicted TIM-barrel fold metal-dependent hydrolase
MNTAGQADPTTRRGRAAGAGATERYLVISSDCHAGLPPERYRDYVDPKYREAFDAALPIMLQMMDEATKKFLVEGFYERWRQGIEQGLTGAWDSNERNRQLDGDGIAGEVIFPDGVTQKNTPPFGAGLALPTQGVDPELQWAGARAHNRWLAEFCAESPERRAGVAIVPMLYDIDEAVAEIRLAKANGLRGIMIPVLFEGFEPYHHPRYEPIWATCAELDMVIHTHGAAAPDYGDSEGTMGIYITEVAWWSARPVWFLLWGGVFERYPNLKFVVTELGASWVPELKALMDQRFSPTHFNAKLGNFHPNLRMKPSEYFDRNCFVGASVISRSDVEMRHAIGVENIMWGSDFPHPEGAWPKTREFMKESFHGFPENEVRAILGGNAATVYGFDLDKLAPLVDRIGPAPAEL